MPHEKPPELASGAKPGTFSQHANDWLQQFLKHFELHFIDACETQPPTSSDLPSYQSVAIQAVLQTLRDSGLETEAILELLGQVAVKRSTGVTQWTAALNQRRFALIDKQIQGTLQPSEAMELAGLTSVLREHVESEINLPTEGAKALHQRLLQLASTDPSR